LQNIGSRCRVSALPLAVEAASLIEKETEVLRISNKIKHQLFGILNFGHCDLPALLNNLLDISGINFQRYIYDEHGHIMSLTI